MFIDPWYDPDATAPSNAPTIEAAIDTPAPTAAPKPITEEIVVRTSSLIEGGVQIKDTSLRLSALSKLKGLGASTYPVLQEQFNSDVEPASIVLENFTHGMQELLSGSDLKEATSHALHAN